MKINLYTTALSISSIKERYTIIYTILMMNKLILIVLFKKKHLILTIFGT